MISHDPKKRVLLIIPAYNEEQNIEATIRQITAYPQQERYVLDYIVIDDGSTDRTGEICRQNRYPCVHLVQNLGIGGAVQTGYLYASSHQYDAAVQFDGDGQHDIRSLNAILAPILEGTADFLRGVPVFGQDKPVSLHGPPAGGNPLSLGAAADSHRPAHLRPHLRIPGGIPGGGGLFARQYPVDYPEPESLVLLQKKGIPRFGSPGEHVPQEWREILHWVETVHLLYDQGLFSHGVRVHAERRLSRCHSFYVRRCLPLRAWCLSSCSGRFGRENCW